MRNSFHLESEPKYSYSKSRSSHKDDEGSIIPISRIDDYQTSISNFSTRNESGQLQYKKDKKKVLFNPLISVVNVKSFKKENYELTNDVILVEENKKEQKCILCSIF